MLGANLTIIYRWFWIVFLIAVVLIPAALVFFFESTLREGWMPSAPVFPNSELVLSYTLCIPPEGWGERFKLRVNQHVREYRTSASPEEVAEYYLGKGATCRFFTTIDSESINLCERQAGLNFVYSTTIYMTPLDNGQTRYTYSVAWE